MQRKISHEIRFLVLLASDEWFEACEISHLLGVHAGGGGGGDGGDDGLR